jgi:putative ABC transport system substrate-binding protein
MLTRLVVTAFFLLVPIGAQAQSRPVRVGVLIPELDRPQSQSIKGLKEMLKQVGFEERKHIIFEIRDAKGDRAGLEPAAKELVAKKTEVIFTTGTRATRAAKAATRDLPIVFIHPGDPIRLGLAKSLEGSGANLTGVGAFASQTTEKRMGILKDLLPGLRQIHVFFDSNDPFARENFETAKAAAQKLRLEVVEHGVKSSDELKSSVGQLESAMNEAFFHMPDDLVESEADFIFETIRKKRLPSMFNEDFWAIKGAMAAYGPNYYEMGRQAARLVEAILKGRKAETLPIQRANKFDLTLNYRTANFIGVNLSQEMLKKADRVIR